MIELRTLGIVELRGSQGQELRSILQQPKRLAMLAYLALARPQGFRRRDSLIALFWATLDHQRGRAALRQALHVLRAGLGSEVLIGRGEDDIAIEPTALWCDAVAFDQEIGANEPEAALALYRGDLLEGFFFGGGSAEFEHWLDEERSRCGAGRRRQPVPPRGERRVEGIPRWRLHGPNGRRYSNPPARTSCDAWLRCSIEWETAQQRLRCTRRSPAVSRWISRRSPPRRRANSWTRSGDGHRRGHPLPEA
jgi:hypothetical protein